LNVLLHLVEGAGTASNAEGEYINITSLRCYDHRLSPSFDRQHIPNFNYVWDLPRLKSNNWPAKGDRVNGWQLTGVTQFRDWHADRARLWHPGDQCQPAHQRVVDGSGPRPVITGNAQPSDRFCEGFRPDADPDAGDQSRAAAAFDHPDAGDQRDRICQSLKNFSLGGEGSRNLQLRMEMFNVFNHSQVLRFQPGADLLPEHQLCGQNNGASAFLSDFGSIPAGVTGDDSQRSWRGARSG
jgi:hypothetical protein